MSIDSDKQALSPEVVKLNVSETKSECLINDIHSKNDITTVVKPNVIGNLKKNIDFWFKINANDYILDVIANGYKIPFKDYPESKFLKNNRSSLDNDDFVKGAINELLLSGAVSESFDIPFVVNPLTVAQNTSKKRLVLDLRHINSCVLVDKIKFDDWKLASQYLDQNSYMFSFDLTSGYHHIEIHENYRKYLGFSWDFDGTTRYFFFNVLPFGLATAGHIFTKTVRCLVKHWREAGIKIIVYLDDGLCIENDFYLALRHSQIVRQDLLDSGFVSNEPKSNWYPVQCLIWLGIQVNTQLGVLNITQRRIDKAMLIIDSLIDRPRTTARRLACLAGMITSMSFVIGPVTSLMLRYCHVAIINRKSWDSYFNLDLNVQTEICYWKHNLSRLNSKCISEYSLPERVIYSDASNDGCGGYIVEVSGSKCFRRFSDYEKSTSSTYRELCGVFTVLTSSINDLRNKEIKWFTDNQAVVSIVNKGSMRMHLHELALKIFELANSNNVNIDICWLSRNDNIEADLISRTIDRDDWGVSASFFKFLDFCWGPHSIDRFADELNAKTSRFNSRFRTIGSEGVDDFAFNWSGENNWLVPPIYLIIKCIKHLCASKAMGTLIVPYWPSASFWPFLVYPDNTFREYIVNYKEFSNARGVYVLGSVPTVFNDEFKGSVLALRVNALSSRSAL